VTGVHSTGKCNCLIYLANVGYKQEFRSE